MVLLIPYIYIYIEISYQVWVNVVKVMLGLLTAAASAAASIVYIAHYGNPQANWFPICQQYNSFCERISGSLIGSYIAVALFVILILLSQVAISWKWWCVLYSSKKWSCFWIRDYLCSWKVSYSVFAFGIKSVFFLWLVDLLYRLVLDTSIYVIWNVNLECLKL